MKFLSNITAPSFIRTGGTASQILAADGSLITAGSGITISGGTISASAASGVTSFNTRTGAVTLSSGDVTTALGFTPYNSTNPSGYVNSTGVLNTVLTPYAVGSNTAVTTTDTIETAIEKLQGQINARGTGTVTSVSGTGTVSGLTLSGTVTSSGSLTLGGTLTLTSGQVTTALGYTPYNSSNPSGYITSSGSITGSAYSGFIQDTRNSVTGPNTGARQVRWDFVNNATDGLSDGGTFHGVMTFQQWADSSGGGTRQLGFTDNDNLWIRGSGGSQTSYNAWKLLLNSSNYNSYAPTLTGGGASGTWGINVTGTASSISGFNNPTTAATGNTIVYRDGNADISGRYYFGNYINMSDDGNPGGGTAITSFITKQGDNYYRSVSPTNAMASIRGVASGSWGINITGSAGSANNANYATSAGSITSYNNPTTAATANTIAYRDGSANLTAAAFVRSGGTSGQIMMGDGSVITAGTNITISGGTISASAGSAFSGTVNRIPKFTTSTSIGDSNVYEDGSLFSVNDKFTVNVSTGRIRNAFSNTQGTSYPNSVSDGWLARGWVQFNGTGTVSISASGNISSLTDNGVGDYSLNFATSMPDSSYTVVYTNMVTGRTDCIPQQNQTSPLTTGSCRISSRNAGGSAFDAGVNSVAIFR